MKTIEFSGVFKYYDDRLAINNFSLSVEQNERLVLLGPSGCGKTTVLRLLAGFLAPDSGRIDLSGETVAKDGQNLKEPEERNVGMVFQDLALWPHLTVQGNLEFGLKARGIQKQEREQRINETLRLVRMEEYLHAKPANLSGGQQQRIALARALVLQPPIMLMDEPLSSLDYELNLDLRKEIIRLHSEIGFTLVYVTHNLEEAFSIATRIVLMKNGNIHKMGLPEEIKWYFTNSQK
jgi:ABC-type Fe3+/spermidine/putrescine transport system ATPase subunit